MPSRDKYTNPELRDQVKQEVHQGDKGGASGQWSARKAQMVASEYKRRGGSYTTDKETGQDESQKHLDQWSQEQWQTKEGSGTATKDDGTRQRYLPKRAWEKLSDEEKEETEAKKEQGSKEGRQYVRNTEKAKEKRRDVSERRDDDGEKKEGEKEQEDEGGEAKAEAETETKNGANRAEEEKQQNRSGQDEAKDKGEDEDKKKASDHDKFQTHELNDGDEDKDAYFNGADEYNNDDAEFIADGGNEEQEEPRGQKRSPQPDGSAGKKQKANDGTANGKDE